MAFGRLFSSATGQGYATSLAIHCGVLTSLWAASGWLVAPLQLERLYGGRRQQAIELSITMPGAESEEMVRPQQPVVITPDSVRMEDRRFVYAPATTDAPDVELSKSEAASAVLPRRSSQSSNDELEQATPTQRPRLAARRPSATPEAAQHAALPPAPIRFIGRPPRYPAEALARGWEGTVTLLVHLDADGSVLRVEIEKSSGMGAADAEAVRTVQTWRAVALYPNERLTAQVVRKPVQFILRQIAQ
jgi:protein TonB